jgi:ferric-dicitrate binding protein FerR (iron transport regulator)
MSERPRSTRAIAAEARTWFKKLSSTSVSHEDIWAYAAWSRDKANRAAYERVEARSRRSTASGPFTEADLLAALQRRPDLASAYQAAFTTQGRPASLADIARVLAERSSEERHV